MGRLSTASLLIAASLGACAPAPVSVEAPVAPAKPALPPLVTPSRWLVPHPEGRMPTVWRKLPQGGDVYGDADGARWIAVEADAGPAKAETATMLVPERINAIVQADGRWVFFGASGRAFVARSPLGAIEEVRPAPAPVVRSVTAGRTVAMAVGGEGVIYRTTDGGTRWVTVALPDAISGAVPFDVALLPDGSGMLLAAPQQAALTQDEGEHWGHLSTQGAVASLYMQAFGHIESGDERARYQLGGTSLGFVYDAWAQAKERLDLDAERTNLEMSAVRALAGTHVLLVAQRPGSPTPKFAVAAGELDREGAWKDMSELDGCLAVTAAGGGSDLVIGCVRATDRDGGGAEAGAAAPYRIELLRSTDAGAAWSADGTTPAWDRSAALLAGPEGWLMVRQRCPDGRPECVAHAVRAGGAGAFGALAGSAGRWLSAVTVDPDQRRFLALTSEGGEACFDARSLDGTVALKHSVLGPLHPAAAEVEGDVAVDDLGTIAVVARFSAGWKALRSTDEGTTFTANEIGPEIGADEVHLTGSRGVLGGKDYRLWETASAGKTWVPVPALSTRSIQCSREGCLIGNERRLGWDLAVEGDAPRPAPSPITPPLATKAVPVPGAAPLRCHAGEALEIPQALVENVEELWLGAPSAAARLSIPVVGKGERVDVLRLRAAGERITTEVSSLLGPPPSPKATGSTTLVYATSAGVAARRATYPTRGEVASAYHAPVTVDLAWWRPRTGKVVRSKLPPLGKGVLRGTYQLRGGYDREEETLWLMPDGLLYRPAFGDREPASKTGFVVSDTGRVERFEPHLFEPAAASTAAFRMKGGDLAWVDLGSPANVDVVGKEIEKTRVGWTLWPPFLQGRVAPGALGKEPAVLFSWSDGPDASPRGFSIPVRTSYPPDSVDLHLSTLAVAHPPACTDAAAALGGRILMTLPRAARHPVLVEGPSPELLLAEAALVVVPASGDPCVAEWIARRGDTAAIVPVAHPSQAWRVSAERPRWEKTTRSRKVTVRPMRCEEAEGAQIPEALGWKGFAE
jgi:hypothetical protein